MMILLTTFFAGCVSQGTLDRAKATAIELGKDAIGAAKEKAIADVNKFKDEKLSEIDARAAEKLSAIVAADADLEDADKQTLLDQIKTREAAGGLGGLSALAGIAFAFAKAKAAAKARKALGTVVKSIEKAPAEIAETVRELVKANGGGDPEIKATITAAKS